MLLISSFTAFRGKFTWINLLKPIDKTVQYIYNICILRNFDY
jgi:hypothetical protein